MLFSCRNLYYDYAERRFSGIHAHCRRLPNGRLRERHIKVSLVAVPTILHYMRDNSFLETKSYKRHKYHRSY